MFTAPATPLMEFQSTPPARGATDYDRWNSYPVGISIHAPREGGDLRHFRRKLPAQIISIHTPREGGDADNNTKVNANSYFNPRPP